MHISEAKQRLRESIVERLKQMSDIDRKRESRSICRRLLQNIPKESNVCVYSALKKTEPDLTMFIEELLKREDHVYFPFFEDKYFVFRRATDINDLKPGKLKILEPPENSELVNAKDINFVLIPGRAFDHNGNRLGRGNGGYDNWIANQRKKNSNTIIWGIAFECQIVNEIPMEKHDQKVDGIVSARGIV